MRAFLFLILFTASSFAQSGFQRFISYVNSISDVSVKSAKIDSFMLAHQSTGFPVIEGDTANFIYRGSASAVSVAGDFNGWSSSASVMNKLTSTNFFYYSRKFELNARLDYKFVTNGSNWILDPLNPRICSGGFGPNSELAMPLYVQPQEIVYNSAIPHGTIITRSITSTFTSSAFQLKIYLPPGYDSLSTKRYPSVYFQDGYEYIDLASSVNVLDNLIAAGAIEPVIGVFVKPNNRNEEYAGATRNAYKNFFVNELAPLIDALYKTAASPDRRLVLGDSYGGNISAYIVYYHPDVFGNCGIHSGAFQPNGYEVYNLFINNPALNVKFVSIWGTYESLFTNMRNFRDNLTNKGYYFKWMELPEGHSWGLWRATLDYILINIFPAVTDVNENRKEKDQSDIILQNYPNPFMASTQIRYQISGSRNQRAECRVLLKVYDVLGNEVATLADGNKLPGMYESTFPDTRTGQALSLRSGVYFISLTFDEQRITKPILLIR